MPGSDLRDRYLCEWLEGQGSRTVLETAVSTRAQNVIPARNRQQCDTQSRGKCASVGDGESARIVPVPEIQPELSGVVPGERVHL